MIIIHTVNNNPTYRPRLLEQSLRRLLGSFPAVVITGARQTGKSTLVRHAEPDRLYVTLDDLDVQAQAQAHPEGLLEQEKRIALDEVQRFPDLLLAVKRLIDRKKQRGQFILTGSANLLLMKRVSESLAGRAAYLTLMPLTRRERLGLPLNNIWQSLLSEKPSEWSALLNDTPSKKGDWILEAQTGGFPVPALELTEASERSSWFAGYTRTYLERDLLSIASVSSLVDFRRLMKAVCNRIGSLVNQSDIGRDIGLSQSTVHRYLNTLEASHQLVRIPAYAVNRTKRLVKSSKVYWTDTALALNIAGEPEPCGHHLENLVAQDLMAWKGTGWQAEILYWRTTAGAEVDFIVEAGERLLPVEVKTTSRPTPADARHCSLFRTEYPRKSLPGLLLHAGDSVHWLLPDVLAVPWWKVM